VPQLVQPVRPTLATVKPQQATAASSTLTLTKTKFSDLNADEKEQLQRLDDEY
jgi:hypothetical protein